MTTPNVEEVIERLHWLRCEKPRDKATIAEAIAALEQRRWRDTREKLPAPWAVVLFVHDGYVYEGQLDDDNCWRSVATDGQNDDLIRCNNDSGYVTHWMPLPEPPK